MKIESFFLQKHHNKSVLTIYHALLLSHLIVHIQLLQRTKTNVLYKQLLIEVSWNKLYS